MTPTFYQNKRGEFVMTHALFSTLDPDALAKGKLKMRREYRKEQA
jgi:hypothetical protein